MFKTKTLLVEVSARATLLEEQLVEEKAARKAAEDLARQVPDLKDLNAALLAEKHALEIKNAVLLERLDLMGNYINPGSAPRLQGPTSMPEEAEDALFAFRNGDIDKSALERELAQAGYDHTEIEFELSEYPHRAAEQ